jgi:transposase
MLRPSAPDLKVYLHREPIDMRAGRNRLAAIAREVMQKDPFSNTCFLYTNKRYTALKILAWDINGFSLYHKVYVAAELMLLPR